MTAARANYSETRPGYRARFSHVLNFDLTNPNGVHFNFLDEIDPANPVAGADNIASAVPRPANADGHFEPAADRLMAAVILHVLHGEPDHEKNMGKVVRLIAQGDEAMTRIVLQASASGGGGPDQRPVRRRRVGRERGDGMKYRQSVYNSGTGQAVGIRRPGCRPGNQPVRFPDARPVPT